jgi:GNAT superfamily N-acetyltransferase
MAGQDQPPKIPSLTTEDVTFALATSDQQKAAWTLNGESWATPMSVPAYVARETYLSSQALTASGGCKYWVVAPKSDPSIIVASCESTAKEVLVWDRTAGFRKAKGFAIASVYTNPEYRRLGMAGFMLRELQAWFDAQGEGDKAGDAEFSALYSDIGTDYYAKLGWPVYPSLQATLRLTAAPDAKLPNPITPGFGVSNEAATRYLTKEELRPVCDRDVAALTERFAAGFGDSEKTHVAFLPSWEQIAWQLAREEFMAREMFSKEIVHRGAVSASGNSWVVFDHDWREKKLKVQRIFSLVPEPVAEDQTRGNAESRSKYQEIRDLVEATLAEAARWGLQKVLIWNPDEVVTDVVGRLWRERRGEVQVVLDERLDGSIPSLRLRAGRDMTDVVWEENEYYAWC